MKTAIRSWKLKWLAVPAGLWLGAEMSAGLWLLGYPELSWLGAVAAAAVVATAATRRAVRRRSGPA